ncbi:MAG: nuclear transport factor 2 family protein [Solirubrobacteraceae bacterium]|nr:nuclear transport factor 2 family protein [Solirubrobacteraceae bacterium]
MQATDASTAAEEILRRYYDAIDNQRTDEVIASFEPDATVRPANGTSQPWMQGMQAMAQQLRGTAGTRHVVTRVVAGEDGQVAYEVDVTYILKNGEELTLGGAAFCRITGNGRFGHMNLYIDLGPVFEALGR